MTVKDNNIRRVSGSSKVNASFRDPSGFVFEDEGIFLRRINCCYADNYSKFLGSGLYDLLVSKELLISHETVSGNFIHDDHIIIKPQQLDFISYPYEWSFSQLKDAALTTLAVQKLALTKDMSLKDASAYNIQFYRGKATFIDTLSFESYTGGPWVAYQQFCQHFLAPLALMAKTDISLQQLLKVNIDGINLSLASQLLPLRTWFFFGLFIHIHLHAKAQRKNAAKKVSYPNDTKFSKKSFLALLDHLESTVQKLQWQATGTEWHDYYQNNNNYSPENLDEKQALIEEFIKDRQYGLIWDLGANTGRFSQAVANHAQLVCAWDVDPACVDNHYRTIKQHKQTNILPLLFDLTNPSAAIGWANKERMSILERSPADLILALGLVHHLAISNNIPLLEIAHFFASIGRSLIVEFIPKQDSQVKKLLQNRKDIFHDYSEEGFISCFSEYFMFNKKQRIMGTVRTLYFMECK